MVSPCLYVSPCSKNLWGLVQKAQGSVVQPLCVAQVIEHPEHNEQSLKFEPQNEDLKIQIQNRDITNSQVKPAEGLELMSPDSPYPGAIQKKRKSSRQCEALGILRSQRWRHHTLLLLEHAGTIFFSGEIMVTSSCWNHGIAEVPHVFVHRVTDRVWTGEISNVLSRLVVEF